MSLKIYENNNEHTVNVRGIVERIIKYLPENTLRGLSEIAILDVNEKEDCFGAYRRSEQKIDLYVGDIIGWQPWILKKTYIFPYICIGLILGHEIDHHVKRDDVNFDEEISKKESLKYIYPSIGIFKPIMFCLLKCKRI